jgi:hypothetical protein
MIDQDFPPLLILLNMKESMMHKTEEQIKFTYYEDGREKKWIR